MLNAWNYKIDWDMVQTWGMKIGAALLVVIVTLGGRETAHKLLERWTSSGQSGEQAP